MLSFDITDKNIRVVHGKHTNDKLKIIKAAEIELSDDLIENGLVLDIPRLASKINDVLVQNKMIDKEAVVTFASNLIMFKEMHVPKVKGSHLKTIVQSQLQQTLDVIDEQSIAFSVVDEGQDPNLRTSQGQDENQDENQMVKVLATTCPKPVIENFRKVFSMLGVVLKDVSVSCYSITKIVKQDRSLSYKMPLMLIEIDPTFININIYDNGELSFSRFASISPDNYDDREDYMFQAVNENIFRMMQFQKSRSSQPIKDIVFYGDTSLFIRLTTALEQSYVSTSLLKADSGIVGYENLEFSCFANAVGAMIKGDKENDFTNLLDTDSELVKQVDVPTNKIVMQIGTWFLVGAIVIGLAFGIITHFTNKNAREVKHIKATLSSPEAIDTVKRYNALQEEINKLKSQQENIANVTQKFNTLPVMRQKVINDLVTILDDETGEKFDLRGFDFNNGLLSVSLLTKSNDVPARTIKSILSKSTSFANVLYTGYEYEQSKKSWKADIVLEIKGENVLGGNMVAQDRTFKDQGGN